MSEGGRPVRKIAIPDHLWESLETMAREMGADRDALVNQAIFMFARLNGYLTPGQLGAAAPFAEVPAPAALAGPALADRTPGPADRTPGPAAAPAPKPAIAAARAPTREAEERPAPRPAAPPAVAPVAPRASSPSDSNLKRAKPPEPPPQLYGGGANKLDEDPARREVAERVLETAAELERLIKGKSEKRAAEAKLDPPMPAAPPPPPAAAKNPDTAVMDKEGRPTGEKSLYLMAEDGELDKVVKDKFLIGRGKHCDFIINSGKVSREHAVIVREGTDYFVEDLGSSNGTWFNKQRIKRRKIEDGDEYYVCSEKIKCVIR